MTTSATLKTMNWKKLKDNKCPKCSSDLKADNCCYVCSRIDCTFTIRQKKFEKIVNDLYKPKSQRLAFFDENLSELNNLGREEVAEDFSDSKFLDY